MLSCEVGLLLGIFFHIEQLDHFSSNNSISNFYTYNNANVHRGIYKLSQIATDKYEDSRGKIAKFINAKSEKPIIHCGDLNIVHTENDIYDPSPLRRGHSPGTKKYERDNFQKFPDLGYYDAHRYIFPEQKMWTWWDPRSKARSRDAGWRLDYFLVSNKEIIKDGIIHKNIYGSDHCPISLEIMI